MIDRPSIRTSFHRLLPIGVLLGVVLASANAFAQTAPFEPTSGQAGKDVVWVPTPQALVDKMLSMAKVTPQDYVIDLGSGDGRTVITAAKLGATAHGIEYEPQMVALSQRNAAAAGVGGRATFVQADLFESDFSKANVLTMFLLPSINMKLRPKILDMRPGTRVVANTFTMEDWQPDEQATIQDCGGAWCTALLWIVPAKVQGAWRFPQGNLTLTQTFQNVTGTLGAAPISNGKLSGARLTFDTPNGKFSGVVNGATIEGELTSGAGKTAVRAARVQ